MKKIISIAVLLLTLLFISYCDFGPALDAEVKLLDWQQIEENNDNTVNILFEISNTGRKDINKWEISFKITCVEDTTFEHQYTGFNLDTDDTIKEHTAAYISSGYEVRTVTVSDVNIFE